MDNKPRPFSSLPLAQREAILLRARDQRAQAIAAAFRRLGRMLAAPFETRIGRSKATPIPAAASSRSVH